jgi:hypothetical protein
MTTVALIDDGGSRFFWNISARFLAVSCHKTVVSECIRY